jgi:hypothetical protein
VAKDVLTEELGKGFDPHYRKRVDGVFDREESNVKPFGKVEYFSRVDIEEALVTIYLKLIARSKRDSGKYVSAHVVFFNGEIVARSPTQLMRFMRTVEREKVQLGDTYRFINLAAYARKLETAGISAGAVSPRRKESTRKTKTGGSVTRTLKLPNGTYWLVSRTVKQQFKVLAGNKFRFEWLSGTYLGVGTASLSMGFKRSTFKKGGRPYLYPSIVVKPWIAGVYEQ